MADTQLKPCPFCGGEASVIERTLPEELCVVCTRCGVGLRKFIRRKDGSFEDVPTFEPTEMAAVWNRRSDQCPKE